MDKIFITNMSGAEDGKKIEFDRTPIMLGRHPTDNVYLPFDLRVSRHHARITKEKDTYYIEDVGPEGKGSTGGTCFIDMGEGMKVTEVTTKTPTPITSGTYLLLGPLWLKFEYKSDIEIPQKEVEKVLERKDIAELEKIVDLLCKFYYITEGMTLSEQKDLKKHLQVKEINKRLEYAISESSDLKNLAGILKDLLETICKILKKSADIPVPPDLCRLVPTPQELAKMSTPQIFISIKNILASSPEKRIGGKE